MVDRTNPLAPVEEEGVSRLWWMLPVLVLVGAYANILTAGFVWDDHDLIERSPLLRTWTGFGAHFAHPFWSDVLVGARSFYRPLVTLSFALDHAVWGNFAGGYHATNVLVHLACVLLLCALCRRWGAGRTVACLLGALFAVTPRLTESVAWIAGRTDVTATMFCLLALLAYRPGPGNARSRWLAAMAIFAGLFCKEVALAAAVGLGFWSFAEAGKTRIRRALGEVVPLLVVGGVYAAIRTVVMAKAGPVEVSLGESWASRALAFGEAVARYAWMLVDPLRPRLQIGDRFQLSLPLACIGFALVAAAGILLWRKRARISPRSWVAIGIFSVGLLLVLHLIPLRLNVVAADRFLYLPLAALTLGLAPTVERVVRSRKFMTWVMLALVGVFSVATAMRARAWGNEITLWRGEVASSSVSAVLPRVELAVALSRKGRFAEALGIVESAEWQRYQSAVVNRASFLDKLGRRREALAVLQDERLNGPGADRSRRLPLLMLVYARDRDFARARAVGVELTSRFPDRSDIHALVEKLETAATEWASFPPESLDEGIAVRWARAHWFATLGALPEAQARMAGLAADPTVEAGMALQAGAYLAFEGEQSVATAALASIAARGIEPQTTHSLRAVVEERYAD